MADPNRPKYYIVLTSEVSDKPAHSLGVDSGIRRYEWTLSRQILPASKIRMVQFSARHLIDPDFVLQTCGLLVNFHGPSKVKDLVGISRDTPGSGCKVGSVLGFVPASSIMTHERHLHVVESEHVRGVITAISGGTTGVGGGKFTLPPGNRIVRSGNDQTPQTLSMGDKLKVSDFKKSYETVTPSALTIICVFRTDQPTTDPGFGVIRTVKQDDPDYTGVKMIVAEPARFTESGKVKKNYRDQDCVIEFDIFSNNILTGSYRILQAGRGFERGLKVVIPDDGSAGAAKAIVLLNVEDDVINMVTVAEDITDPTTNQVIRTEHKTVQDAKHNDSYSVIKVPGEFIDYSPPHPFCVEIVSALDTFAVSLTTPSLDQINHAAESDTSFTLVLEVEE